jgi:hypothetical protein
VSKLIGLIVNGNGYSRFKMKVKELIRDLQNINPDFDISLIDVDNISKSRDPDIEVRIHEEDNVAYIAYSLNKFLNKDYLYWCDPI